MGIYYAAPLLGPSLGPIVGGVLTDAWNWRATFFFLAAFCSISLTSFILFKDTFRKERSLAYQAALARARAQKARRQAKCDSPPDSERTSIDGDEKTVNGDPIKLPQKDIEAQVVSKAEVPAVRSPEDLKLSLSDVNPLAPLPQILKIRSNLIILLASGRLGHVFIHHLPLN